MYNRVPKCGSTAVHVIMGKLSHTLNYSLYISSDFTHHYLQQREGLRRVVAKSKTLREPWIFDRHVFFVNFSDVNEPMPVYINNIRDPVDRIASWYYFIRFQPMHIRPMSEQRRNRTYDECVQEGHEECVNATHYSNNNNFMYIPFFCGSQPFCLEQTSEALNQAKQNVVQYFAVVGLAEDLETFFSVLEFLLPQYFTGASQAYSDSKKSLLSQFKTKRKVAPSEKTRDIMKTLLPMEYDFYYFVKQRFYYTVDMMKTLQNQTTTF